MTTKAIAKPSAGRASGGPAMDTSVSSGPDHACGPLLDVAADHVEHQVDAAGVFQRVVLKIDDSIAPKSSAF